MQVDLVSVQRINTRPYQARVTVQDVLGYQWVFPAYSLEQAQALASHVDWESLERTVQRMQQAAIAMAS